MTFATGIVADTDFGLLSVRYRLLIIHCPAAVLRLVNQKRLFPCPHLDEDELAADAGGRRLRRFLRRARSPSLSLSRSVRPTSSAVPRSELVNDLYLYLSSWLTRRSARPTHAAGTHSICTRRADTRG